MKKDVKNYELIELELLTKIKYSCMVVEFRKNDISTLPLEPFVESDVSPELVPRVAIPTDIILKYKKMDQATLLFLINEENPHLKNAINKMLYDGKDSRKN